MPLDIDRIEPVEDHFFPSTTEEARLLADLVGEPLPCSYIDFACQYGCCMFNGEASVVTAEGKRLGIFTIFGLSDGRDGVMQDLKMHDGYLANGYVPIADDLSNNRYVMEKGTRKISFFEYGGGVPRLIPVAVSFDDFLARIEVVDDEL